MFDDFRDAELEFEFGDAMSDRELLYSIYCAGEIGDTSAAEGWGLLMERYPDDARFLLLYVFELLGKTGGERVLRPLERLAARITPEFEAPFRDLLLAAADLEEGDSGGDPALRARWHQLTSKVPKDDLDDVYERLGRFGDGVLKECHERTLGGQSLKLAPSPPI